MFVQAVQNLHPRVAADLGLEAEAQGVTAVVHAVKGRKLAQKGRTPGGTRYAVHGLGCLFTLRDGTEVDLDITADGDVIFDSWRLRRFGDSVGRQAELSDLNQALAELVSSGRLVHVRGGWYCLPAAVGGA